MSLKAGVPVNIGWMTRQCAAAFIAVTVQQHNSGGWPLKVTCKPKLGQCNKPLTGSLGGTVGLGLWRLGRYKVTALGCHNNPSQRDSCCNTPLRIDRVVMRGGLQAPPQCPNP